MNTDKAPGPWGLYCKQCGQISLAFCSAVAPSSLDLLEDLDFCQRGMYPSKRRTGIQCHHCQTPIPTVQGYIIEDRVVLIDNFIKSYAEKKIRAARKHGRGALRGLPVMDREFHGVHYLDGEDAQEPIDYEDAVLSQAEEGDAGAQTLTPEKASLVAKKKPDLIRMAQALGIQTKGLTKGELADEILFVQDSGESEAAKRFEENHPEDGGESAAEAKSEEGGGPLG